MSALHYDVPDGSLQLGADDLDPWAEHLAWCYRLLGVRSGETMAIQDYGSSPLCFLAASLLTPLLKAGVSERLGCNVVCLDGSRERVALTPALLLQLQPQVLVVRAEVAALLTASAEERRIDLAANGSTRLIVAGSEEVSVPPLPGWQRLLVVERALLFAPLCPQCGHYHLSRARYAFDGHRASALAPNTVGGHTFRNLRPAARGACTKGPGDWRLSFDPPELEP